MYGYDFLDNRASFQSFDDALTGTDPGSYDQPTTP